jgi:hypothetical protein
MNAISNPTTDAGPASPFFIVGCPRSGNTLVSRILDGHSRIAVYHESHYYHFFGPDLHRYGDLRRMPNLKRFIDDVRAVIRAQKKMAVPEEREILDALIAPTFEGVLATVLRLYARQQGKSRSGDKTPGHHAYLSEILNNLPESSVIFVVRDPRDTVLAIREHFGISLKGATWLWNSAFINYRRFSHRVHRVRYEDLVQKPMETTEALCAYLGERYEPDMLRFFEKIPAWLSSMRYKRGLLEPIGSRYVGTFRQMPRRDIETIEAACAAGMEAVGYEFSFTKPRATPIIPPTKADLLIDRLRFYRWNWGRWRRGWMRWKIVLRLRVRYFLSLRPLRESGKSAG